MNSSSNNFSKAIEVIYDIAKKIDTEKDSLSLAEIMKLLSFSIETCMLICEKSSNPKEKEYFFNQIKLLNAICKEYNGVLLQKYLRLILTNSQVHILKKNAFQIFF